MIEYRNVKKSYGGKLIIKGVDLTVEKGEFVVLIGPSGCGKTTTLKMLNRLIEPSEGSIWINGADHREIYRICDSADRTFSQYDCRGKYSSRSADHEMGKEKDLRSGKRTFKYGEHAV